LCFVIVLLDKNQLGLYKYLPVKTVSTIREIHEKYAEVHLRPSGFVPTMGALHEGHISLVNEAVKLCPVTTVSIFVNPAQFNDKEDLKNYPRTPEKDLELLKKVLRENDIVFIPDDREIYPEEDKRVFSFGNIDKVMEGLHRPGHFNGVAKVVSKLFDIVKPDFAFFGQKDFQQLAIIKELVRQTGNKVKIIGCPIIRESDGLALSSRNQLLEPEIRKNADIIFRTISEAASMAAGKEIVVIKEFVKKSIDLTKGFNIEYFEIVDETGLIPLKNKNEVRKGVKYFGCIAVKAGKIRLIDNIEISLL
jgi:pantoate--beta-alanine ligase